MIIVDTSVLIDLLRGKNTEATLSLAIMDDRNIPFSIPVVCCQELLQGARNEREWKKLSEYLNTQHLVDLRYGWQSYKDAARIFFDCRRKGRTVRSTIDCIVAQIALEYNAELLHDDQDFEHIAKVRDLKKVLLAEP